MLALLTLSAVSSQNPYDRPQPGNSPPKDPQKTRFQLLSFLVKVLAETFDTEETVKPNDDKDITAMTWNILAPMWVNKAEMKARGVIDMNLMKDDVRLTVEMERILAQQPDILFLQEVQEDTYKTIKRYLSKVYSSVSFAPNIKEYWKSYLKEGQPYTKNGVATFYKRKTFILLAQKSFETSVLGSIAQLTVLQRKQASRRTRPIIVVNCHLEAAVSAAGALTRTLQGNAIIAEAEKQLVAFNNSKFANSQPVVIIAGDLNTQSPFPGYNNFKAKGYSSAAEVVGKTAIPTVYYQSPLAIPGSNLTVDSTAIDYVFIRNDDKSSGKISVLSAEAPTIDTYEMTEKAYIKRVTKILLKKLANSRQWQFWMTMRSPLFTTLMRVINDGQENNHKANQVMRLGSDHLPVTVTIQIN